MLTGILASMFDRYPAVAAMAALVKEAVKRCPRLALRLISE